VPLLLGYDLGGLEPNTRQWADQLLAGLQTWAAQVDGVNAAERLNALASGIAGLSGVQTGTIHEYGGDTAPTGYLMADGAAHSRATYAALFAVYGVKYGAGNGSTTFNVPDRRRRVAMGISASDALGDTGGSFDHTHTGGAVSGSTDAVADHTHSAGSYAVPAHDHGGETGISPDEVERQPGPGAPYDDNDYDHTHPIDEEDAMSVSGTSGADGGHSHGAGTLAVASTGAANPPYIMLNFIVKT
jgi:microcystin-dependent protein